MNGVGIQIDVSDLDKAIPLLSRLVDFDPSDLMTNIAALGESQTRRRIETEKTAPDGSPWAPNAEGTSILLRSGMYLRDSVASNSDGSTAEWGASWEFAHVHQHGATIVPKSAKFLVFHLGGGAVRAKKVTVPARPFVGLSAENTSEIRDLVTDYLGGLLQ